LLVVSSSVVRQLLPKSNKHGTHIDHKWSQVKKRKRKEPKKENTIFLQGGAIFSKIGGLNGWAFTDVLRNKKG
jgi:hypothetical protein